MVSIKRIIQALLERSTEVVLDYRQASGCLDNDIPEEYISSNIVVPLHRDLGLLCRREWLYSRIAKALDVPIGEEVLASIGGFCADLALYDGERPCAVVELKIDDGGPSRPRFAIVSDMEKLRKLLQLCPITSLSLVMMTDLVNRKLADRRAELQNRSPGAEWIWAPTQRAKDGGWCWAMGCAQVGAKPNANASGASVR